MCAFMLMMSMSMRARASVCVCARESFRERVYTWASLKNTRKLILARVIKAVFTIERVRVDRLAELTRFSTGMAP